MPIQYWIDHDRRIVLALGQGRLQDEDVFGYQRTVWSRPEVAGFDELVDMSEVEGIDLPSPDRVGHLAVVSATMDSPSLPSRLAIIAPGDLAFGLGRMYEAHRRLDERSTKKVGVFRTRAEALAFLGIQGPLPFPGWG